MCYIYSEGHLKEKGQGDVYMYKILKWDSKRNNTCGTVLVFSRSHGTSCHVGFVYTYT